ncbi:hypothetical protein [Nocardioides limicola]|uniref:hypothetical protein n=1 Tax=Nocardioides limicola TaxID=2803368 RepID=UPI00193BDCA1|nr:hypothetical protein [Nocardioides sp. DJM-14]
MSRRRGMAVRRFVVWTGSCLTGCLAMAGAVVLGLVPVSFAAAEPFPVSSSAAVADRIQVASGSAGSVTGLSPAATEAVAAIRMEHGRLDDLCLTPGLTVPGLGRAGLRIRSAAPVRLGVVTLAAGATEIDEVTLAGVTVGASLSDPSPGAMAVRSAPGPASVRIAGLDGAAYGLVLDQGLRLRHLSLMPTLDRRPCR